jgi:hypothetical protein
MTVVNSSVMLTNGAGGRWCMGIKRDKSGKSSSQIVTRIWNSRPSCMICEKANLWRIHENVIKSDEKWTLNIPIYENTPSYPPFFLYAHSRNFIIHKYWHTHKHKQKYDIWTSQSLSANKPDLNWVAGNVREEYCKGQTCKMGYN